MPHCSIAALAGMFSGMGYHGFVAVQARGTIALPPELRKRYQLDRPGAQVEITEVAPGVWQLRPVLPIPADQAWFWTPEWQAGEREVDEELAAGRVRSYQDGEEFIAALDDMIAAADAEDPHGRAA